MEDQKTKVAIVVETDDEDGGAFIEVRVNGVRIAAGRAGGGEPEDNTFNRDYDWIDGALVSLAKALGADATLEVKPYER